MKTSRHTAIRDLIVKTSVTSQDELRRKLAQRGIHVTQATLSRDIRDLHLVKTSTGYALPSDQDDDDVPEIARVMEDFALEVRQAQNQLVLLTITGCAAPVSAAIDHLDWPEVVGTIAGENTVLIICPDNRKAEALKSRIEAYLA
jgi:transcriptional regulator of arginine metabolism